MSRVLPVLFNTDMVRAILDGRKTVTRRLVKLPKYIQLQDDGLYTLFADGTCYENQHMEDITDYMNKPYQPGDILWVQETWKILDVLNELSMKFEYRADGKISGFIDFISERMEKFRKFANKNGWQSPYFMPKEAARIWLKVKDVRVERLQDITHDGPMKEGIQYDECPTGFTWKQETDMHNCYTTPMGAMQALWNSTIKKSDIDRYGWNASPWVWVIEFERCEKPEDI